MKGVSSIAPSHPTHPIAHFLRILRDLAITVTRQPPSRTLSEHLLETLIWHLEYFICRLVRAAIAPDRAMKPRPNPATTTTRRRVADRPPGPMMRCTAWLVHLAPIYLPELVTEIEAARTELEILLSDGTVQTLATETPKIGRILRPLCRMFGIEPPACLRLPPPIRKPRPPKPPKPRQPRDYGFTLIGCWDALGLPATPTPKKTR